MENIKFKREGNILLMKIDLSKVVCPSNSGRNNIVCKTGGAVQVPGVPGNHMINLTIYRSLDFDVKELEDKPKIKKRIKK